MIDKMQTKKVVKTSRALMSYVELGSGFPAIFIHGVGQSSYFWRHQMKVLSNTHRCLSVDLMAHGHTEAHKDQDVSFREQAEMILEALTQLGIDKFDLVLNDSGGAIGQIMATKVPGRVRSMVLTNCDVHDNWPPLALNEIRGAAQAGTLADQYSQFLEHPEAFRQPGGIAEMVYEDPQTATDENLKISLAPIVSTPERRDAFNRYVGFQDHSQLTAIESDLRKLKTPSLIVWGTDDVFFPIEWAHWLKKALPNARDIVELEGAKLFFPEERPDELNTHIRAFWNDLS